MRRGCGVPPPVVRCFHFNSNRKGERRLPAICYLALYFTQKGFAGFLRERQRPAWELEVGLICSFSQFVLAAN
jgi:hypothetical protein